MCANVLQNGLYQFQLMLFGLRGAVILLLIEDFISTPAFQRPRQSSDCRNDLSVIRLSFSSFLIVDIGIVSQISSARFNAS